MVRVCAVFHLLDLASDIAQTQQKGIGLCHRVADGSWQCASRELIGWHISVSESDFLFSLFPYRLSVEEYG